MFLFAIGINEILGLSSLARIDPLNEPDSDR